MKNPECYRVVCPDGLTADQFDDEDQARRHAIWLDRMHDKALCDEPHRVFVASWAEVFATTRVVRGVEILVAPDGDGRYIVGYPNTEHWADAIEPDALDDAVEEWARYDMTLPGFPEREVAE